MNGDLHAQRLERRVTRLEARVNTLERLLEVEAEPEAPAGPVPALATPIQPPPEAAPPVAVAPALAAAPPTPPPPTPSYALEEDWGPVEPQAGPLPALPAVAPSGWGGQPGAPAARPSINLRDLEERFAGRALAWIGGFALVAAAVFFLSLAFSRGWITEPMRVLIGLVAGSLALGVGAVSFDRRNPLLGNVLTAVGLGIVSISLFAATRAYALVPPEVGLLGALIASIAAAVIAIHYDAREVAAFGLIAALIAPPVMGASPNTLTLLFVAVTLVGTTAIALFRSWRWLPSIAFILAAPQLASWLVGGADTAQALVALSGFWAVNIVAAAGEEVRIRRDDLRPSSATLVLANAAFLVWGGYEVLGGPEGPWLGTFIALASLAHLAVGAAFLRRQGLQHLFGNLVAGTGAALLALAAFVQLGAALVPVAWAAEAAALAWLAVRRTHVWSALAAVALGGLAVLHLVLVEYPISELTIGTTAYFTAPLWHPEAASLVAVLAAVAVVAVGVPVAWIRSALAGLGVALVAYAAVFEFAGPALPSVLAVAAVAGVALDVAAQRLGFRGAFRRLAEAMPAWFGTAVATVVGACAIAHLMVFEFPLEHAGLSETAYFTTPWLQPAAGALAVALAALAAAAWLLPVRTVRSLLAGIGVVLFGYAATFETVGPALIATLVVVALVPPELDRVFMRRGTRPDLASVDGWLGTSCLATAGAGALRLTAIAALLITQYPIRGTVPPEVPYTDTAALSLAILVGGLIAGGVQLGARGVRSIAAAVSVLLITWSLPFELHDVALIGAGAVLLPLAVLGDVVIARLPAGRRFHFLPLPRPMPGLVGAAGAVAWVLALGIAVVRYFPPTSWGSVTPPAIPFSDETALVAVLLAGAAIAAAAWIASAWGRQLALLAAIVPVALAVPFEVYADFVVVLWLLLAAAAWAVTRPGDRLHPVGLGMAALLGAGAIAIAFAIVAPPARLWVVDPAVNARPPLLAGWWVALAAVAAVPLLASRRPSLAHERSTLEVLAAAIGVYLVSVGVVDVFQRMTGGSIPYEELAKQAQVALSVTWTAIGALALAVGLRTRRAMPRHIGFGLLALATAKVFVVDLAAMDVAYRAIVLAGLGVLLLLSAWLFTHLRGPRAGTPGLHGPRPAG